MTYEELKIKLDLYDPIDVLKFVGRRWGDYWFVVCDEGDCHLFKYDGTEDDIKKIDRISIDMILEDIRKIVIPNSVTSIDYSAFYACSMMTSITIPDSVTSIGTNAFEFCKGLTSVTIPYSVTHIGWDAFTECNKLKSLVFKEKTISDVKAMDNYPFGIKDTSIIKCI